MAGVDGDTAQLDQLAADLRAAGVELAELDPAHDKAAGLVLANARPPRRTGKLAASLTARVTPGGITFASTARYWTFVHWGAPRRQLRARPWYVEAIQPSRDQLVAVYAAHARDAIANHIS